MGELPLNTQVRLLRVLESGEFIKVGSSKSQKQMCVLLEQQTLILRRQLNMESSREDLYYRLNTVPIRVLHFATERKTSCCCSENSLMISPRYRVPALSLQPDAQKLLVEYRWPGNIRQLKTCRTKCLSWRRIIEIRCRHLTHLLTSCSTE